MQRVVVTVKRKDEARVRDLEVPADIDAVSLAKQIARQLGWASDRAGRPLAYQIEAHPSGGSEGRMLQPGESLASAGVWDGSWLVFHAVVVETPVVKSAALETPLEILPSEPEPVAAEQTPSPTLTKTAPLAETGKGAIVEGRVEPEKEELSSATEQTPIENLAANAVLHTGTPATQEASAPIDHLDVPDMDKPQIIEPAQTWTDVALPTSATTPGAPIQSALAVEAKSLVEAGPADAITQAEPTADELYSNASDSYAEVSSTHLDQKDNSAPSEMRTITTPEWVKEAQLVDEMPTISEPQDTGQATLTGSTETTTDKESEYDYGKLMDMLAAPPLTEPSEATEGAQPKSPSEATPQPTPTKPSELASPGAGPVSGWRKVVDLAPGPESAQTKEKPQSRFVWKQLDEE